MSRKYSRFHPRKIQGESPTLTEIWLSPLCVKDKNAIIFPLEKALTKIGLIIRLRGTTNIFRPEFFEPRANVLSDKH
jgi:hypothetical protein